MNKDKAAIYTTQDEMAFLDGLGQHCQRNLLPAAQLLKNYIASHPRRLWWGHIDPAVALGHAKKRLREVLGP